MRRISTAIGLALAASTLAACGSDSGSDSPGSDSPGSATSTPIKGGHLNAMQVAEPRTMDPGAIGNAWMRGSLVGNAIFGTLLVNDAEGDSYTPVLAESFSSSDDGATFDMVLRDGLTFSDGTPFAAEDVKYNWDRLKDPALGGGATQSANLVRETVVKDPRTLSITLTEPIPAFAQSIVTTPMNWIAKPETLEDKSGDTDPVGAGPFTLKSWTRQNTIELERNENYFDPELPYLDSISIRHTPDARQRGNTLTSGGVDLISDSSWASVADLVDAGFEGHTLDLNGGQYIAMNTTRAPFDDIRVRQAMAAALDSELINSAFNELPDKVPSTLFQEDSAFFNDQPLVTADRELARKLFDEASADGVDISFTFKTYPTIENKAVAESVQAQLAEFKNVKVEVQTIDLAETGTVTANRDFDMIVGSASFIDPEPTLYNSFHSTSRSNASGISDPELDAALEQGRSSADLETRRTAYKSAEDRIRELAPGIFYVRAAPGAVWNKKLAGVEMYALGSLRADTMWLTK